MALNTTETLNELLRLLGSLRVGGEAGRLLEIIRDRLPAPVSVRDDHNRAATRGRGQNEISGLQTKLAAMGDAPPKLREAAEMIGDTRGIRTFTVIDGTAGDHGMDNRYFYEDDDSAANVCEGCYVDEIDPKYWGSELSGGGWDTLTRTGGVYQPTVLYMINSMFLPLPTTGHTIITPDDVHVEDLGDELADASYNGTNCLVAGDGRRVRVNHVIERTMWTKKITSVGWPTIPYMYGNWYTDDNFEVPNSAVGAIVCWKMPTGYSPYPHPNVGDIIPVFKSMRFGSGVYDMSTRVPMKVSTQSGTRFRVDVDLALDTIGRIHAQDIDT